MSAARTPGAMVLDVESRNQLVDCPGCGVIAQGHGRVVMEVIDLPRSRPLAWSGFVDRVEGWLLLVMLRPLARVLVG